MIDHEEIAARRRDATNPARAMFHWQVRRMPWPEVTQESVDAAEVLIAEYDVHGILHKLVEIVVPPPYLWVAQSYRNDAGMPSRFIPILPGHERIWEHRVLHHVSIYPQEHPLFMPQWYEDCMLFGRREVLSGAEEVLLVYPDGAAFEFRSLAAAYRHRR